MKNKINTLKKIEINVKWVLLFVLFMAFIIMVHFLLKSQLHQIDDFIYQLIKPYIQPKTTEYIKKITSFGNVFMVLLICLITFLYSRLYGFLMILNVGLTTCINYILKHIFLRERPNILPLITEKSYSFPSGHSMVSIALYGYLFYLAYKKIKRPILRRVICFILLVMILLIGLSRIYLGVHYASDVIAGYFVASIFLIIFIQITSRYVDY